MATRSHPSVSESRASSSYRAQRQPYAEALACGGFILFALGGAAVLGGLRPIDLFIAGAVLVPAVLLALADSRHLPVLVMGIWFFGPLVRRVVDWHGGAFVPVTALSLVPMLATSALAIQAVPRAGRMVPSLQRAMLFIALPVVFAAAVGLARYGLSAGLEACNWLMPLLWIPYFATSPWAKAHATSLLFRIGTLGALSAGYGVVQFLVVPPWDALWHQQSGLTSIGQAIPLKIRVWGSMNAPQPAAMAWILLLVALLNCRRVPIVLRSVLLLPLAFSVCTSLVRTAWMMAVAGLAVLLCVVNSRSRLPALLGAAVLVMVGTLTLPYLPGGETVVERFATMTALYDDNSFNGRQDIAIDMAQQVLANPIGIGIGFKTEARVTNAGGLVVMDNGVGDLLLTLGLAGAIAWFVGIGMLAKLLWIRSRRFSTSDRSPATDELPATAIASLAASLVALLSLFSFAGLEGIVTWFVVGLAFASSRSERQPAIAQEVDGILLVRRPTRGHAPLGNQATYKI